MSRLISCEKVTPALSSYMDEEFDPPTRVLIHDHLRTCTPCRGELGRLRRTAWYLGKMPPVMMHPRFGRTILAHAANSLPSSA